MIFKKETKHYSILEIEVINLFQSGCDMNIPLQEITNEFTNAYNEDYRIYKNREHALEYSKHALKIFYNMRC